MSATHDPKQAAPEQTETVSAEPNAAVDRAGKVDKGLRKIRSFVVRSARMTEAQQRAYEALLARWALPADIDISNSQAPFGNDQPLVIEIGFGMGDSLAAMAEASPEKNFIGIEVHPPGIGRLLNLVEEKQLQNVRVIQGDAVTLLEQRFAAASIDRINIYFPDPWHKKRHHKRRLIQSDFVALLASRIRIGGMLHIASDWEPYVEHIQAVMQTQALFRNLAGEQQFSDAAELGRPTTKFERRGRKLGHGVWDLAYLRSA